MVAWFRRFQTAQPVLRTVRTWNDDGGVTSRPLDPLTSRPLDLSTSRHLIIQLVFTSGSPRDHLEYSR